MTDWWEVKRMRRWPCRCLENICSICVWESSTRLEIRTNPPVVTSAHRSSCCLYAYDTRESHTVTSTVVAILMLKHHLRTMRHSAIFPLPFNGIRPTAQQIWPWAFLTSKAPSVLCWQHSWGTRDPLSFINLGYTRCGSTWSFPNVLPDHIH